MNMNRTVFFEEVVGVDIGTFGDEIALVARVDTGAKTCALRVENMRMSKFTPECVSFSFNGIEYTMLIKRMVKVKGSCTCGKAESRPVIEARIKIRGETFSNVEVTISEANHMRSKFLIGRNLLQLGFTVECTNSPTRGSTELGSFFVPE
jgi:hypothetical protein